jgi:hypothetical protein
MEFSFFFFSMIIGWSKIRKSSGTFLVDVDETNADGNKNVIHVSSPGYRIDHYVRKLLTN